MSTHAFTEPAKKHLGQHFLHERGIIEQDRAGRRSAAGRPAGRDRPRPGRDHLPAARPAWRADRHRVRPRPDLAAHRSRARTRHAEVDPQRRAHRRLHRAGPQRWRRARLRLVGNLPYNLSTPILFHALEHAAAIRDMHFMLQKEVVDRMAAGPGSKVYGRLSVMLQAYCHVTPLFNVPPGAFRPPPKVDSAVVRLVPRDPATSASRSTRFRTRRARCFGQRRKTLRNALSTAVRRRGDRSGRSSPGCARRADRSRGLRAAGEFVGG